MSSQKKVYTAVRTEALVLKDVSRHLPKANHSPPRPDSLGKLHVAPKANHSPPRPDSLGKLHVALESVFHYPQRYEGLAAMTAQFVCT
jgi:hypothetical protein